METHTTADLMVYKTWDDFIPFVLVAICRIKEPRDLEPFKALVEMKKWKGLKVKATMYRGPEIGENYAVPLKPEQRQKLKDSFKKIFSNSADHFVTESRNGEKLYWEAELLKN